MPSTLGFKLVNIFLKNSRDRLVKKIVEKFFQCYLYQIFQIRKVHCHFAEVELTLAQLEEFRESEVLHSFYREFIKLFNETLNENLEHIDIHVTKNSLLDI